MFHVACVTSCFTLLACPQPDHRLTRCQFARFELVGDSANPVDSDLLMTPPTATRKLLLVFVVGQLAVILTGTFFRQQTSHLRQSSYFHRIVGSAESWKSSEYKVAWNLEGEFRGSTGGGVRGGVGGGGVRGGVGGVTLVTQCSVDNAHHLVDTLQRWPGPISVALFAASGADVTHAIEATKALTSCWPRRHDVTFHLVLSTTLENSDHEGAVRMWSEFYREPRVDCATLRKHLRRIERANYRQVAPYPHNTLRNVAKRAARTDHVIVVDVDVSVVAPPLMTSSSFLASAPRRAVFVLPAFEVRSSDPSQHPRNKRELMRDYASGEARIFHQETCPMCHKATNYRDWLSIGESPNLTIAFEIEWLQSWEPFYISHVEVPDYDERFVQYGYDRISQVCELYLSQHRFFVLANHFVLHKGWKTEENFHRTKQEENRRNWMLFSGDFAREMQVKYRNTSRSCIEHSKLEGRSVVSFKPRFRKKQKPEVKLLEDEL